MMRPTQERLKELLRWDDSLNRFVWNKPSKFQQRKIGTVAGSYTDEGYRKIMLDGKVYQEHRLVWLYVHGVHPTGQIDHINCVRDDNRIENLRDVPHQVNRQNMRLPTKSNKSGFLGVSKRGAQIKKNPWAAFITINGKQINLGGFETPESAHQKYLEAKRAFHAGCTL